MKYKLGSFESGAERVASCLIEHYIIRSNFLNILKIYNLTLRLAFGREYRSF